MEKTLKLFSNPIQMQTNFACNFMYTYGLSVVLVYVSSLKRVFISTHCLFFSVSYFIVLCNTIFILVTLVTLIFKHTEHRHILL